MHLYAAVLRILKCRALRRGICSRLSGRFGRLLHGMYVNKVRKSAQRFIISTAQIQPCQLPANLFYAVMVRLRPEYIRIVHSNHLPCFLFAP